MRKVAVHREIFSFVTDVNIPTNHLKRAWLVTALTSRGAPDPTLLIMDYLNQGQGAGHAVIEPSVRPVPLWNLGWSHADDDSHA